MIRQRRGRGEDGATLMLAVAFLLLFSIAIAAILSQAAASIKTTTVVSDRGSKLYAADGGIDYGIDHVHSDDSLCPDRAAGTMDVGDVNLDGRTVHVQCRTLAGDNGSGSTVFGPSGWTTVATGWGTATWTGGKGGDCNPTSQPANDLGSTIQIYACPGAGGVARTVNDASYTVNKDSLKSTTAQFTANDKGSSVTGANIPSGTTIKKVKDAANVQLSTKTTATATNATVTIGGNQAVTFGGTKVFNAGGFKVPANLKGIVQGSITQYDDHGYCARDKTNAAYPNPNDKSPIVGGTWTCVQPADAAVPDPSPNVVVPPDPIPRTINDAVLCSTCTAGPGGGGAAKKMLTSATANFTSADVGASLTGAGIQAGTTVQSVTNATTIQMSKDATVTVPTSNVTVTITPTGTPAAKTGTCAGVTVNYLYPGRYTSKPAWGGYTYFASGVYYIVDTGETAMDGTSLIGGEPGPNDQRFVALPAGCENAFSDAAANAACGGCLPADPGKGVTFILGGSTLLDIHGGTTELFTRVPGTMDAGATPGTTVFAMASSTPRAGQITGGSYKTSATLGADRCNCAFVTDKSLQQIIFHGLTYSPFSPVDVFNNASVAYSPFYGGLVANWIVARVDGGSQSGLFTGQFGANIGPSERTILITATAPGTSPGDQKTVSRAVVTIDVDEAKTTEIQSWRNQD